MIISKPSRNLIFAVGLLATLSLTTVFASQKFLHLTLGHTVYYCQAAIRSLSLQLPAQLGLLLIGALAAVVAFLGVKLLRTYLRVHGLRKNLLQGSASRGLSEGLLNRLQLVDKVFLVPDNKLFAFCFGIHKPKIYLSTALVEKMTPRELEAILLHERSHLENKDSLTLLLASTTQSLFPFFPLLSDFIRNLKVERELRADQAVIRALGESQTLLSVLKKLLLVEGSKLAFAPAVAQADTLELRITALVKNKPVYKKFGFLNIFVSLISLAIIGGLTLAPVHAIENHAEGQEVMMICPNGDSCATWCEQNNTVKPYSQGESSSHPYTTIQ